MSNTVRTLAELEAEFLGWMAREAIAGRCSEATIRYYRRQLGPWIKAVGPEREITSIVAWDLESRKVGWHSVQAVQRLWNWAVDAELVTRSPFKKVGRPAAGQRHRVLARAELFKWAEDILDGHNSEVSAPSAGTPVGRDRASNSTEKFLSGGRC